MASGRGEDPKARAAPSVWCNFGEGARAAPVLALLARLRHDRPDLGAVITAGRDTPLPEPLPGWLQARQRPVDLRKMAERFVREAAPDLVIATGSGLPVAALQAAHGFGALLVLLEGRVAQEAGLLGRWSGYRSKGLLRLFDLMLASSEAEAEALRRSGADPARLEVIGRIDDIPPAPSCDEREREAMAKLLGYRPIWVAAGAVPGEIVALDRAHRIASRASHRLLMVVVPDDPATGPEMAARFRALDWQTGLRSEGEDPEAEVQIYVADIPGEHGLWYRLSPITFLGASLVPEGRGADVMGPAALGSAIVHGPAARPDASGRDRLHRAGCTRIARNADELGEEIRMLLSPDKAAVLAGRAWEVVSEGAEASDRAAAAILAALEARGA